MDALALEYVVAFYPICLILLTYVCIKLHNSNFRPVVWLWKPFHRHFVHFRRRWGLKSINNQCIYNLFASLIFQNFILYLSHLGTPSKFVLDLETAGAERKVCFCIMIQQWKVDTQGVFHFCSFSWLCVGSIHSLSNRSSHFVPHKTVQKNVYHAFVNFADSMPCTCLWNHFRVSTRMEPMILMTSEWFLQYSLSSGF